MNTYKSDDQSLLKQLAEAKKYKRFILDATDKYNLLSSVIVGIGSRESQWGLTLKPKGPEGTGDFTERKGILPPDGLGWGRGLLQIDYHWHEFAQSGNWQDPKENIFYGCKLLSENIRNIRRRALNATGESVIKGFDPADTLRAAIASYNCGILAVFTAIRNGQDIDHYTTHQNYSFDVINRSEWFKNYGWE